MQNEIYESGKLVRVDEIILPPEVEKREILEEQALADIGRNLSLIANNSMNQKDVVEAVKDHARQLNGIIRLLLNHLDDID